AQCPRPHPFGNETGAGEVRASDRARTARVDRLRGGGLFPAERVRARPGRARARRGAGSRLQPPRHRERRGARRGVPLARRAHRHGVRPLRGRHQPQRNRERASRGPRGRLQRYAPGGARHRGLMKGPHMKIHACAAAAIAFLAPLAGAQTSPLGSRDLPARSVPVPDTVSPQMQKLIGAPLTPTWNVIPKTAEEWKAQVNAGYEATMKSLPALREALGVKVEPITLDGVKAYMLTPSSIPPQNRNRLLVHVHGGCFVSFPGESGTAEAIYMAGIGGFRVISVDYRMPPDHPYPAALDDAITAWKAATRMASPKNMAIFGSSAGGNLTLAMVLRAKQEKLPLPAAIAPGTPMSDLTN